MPEGAFALGSLSERQPPAPLVGKAEHKPYQKKLPKEQPFQLLVDMQGKMAEGKSAGYKKWATSATKCAEQVVEEEENTDK